MDCFLDFCLACDKQTSDGFYCSQACRLADLEQAGSSAPTSPLTPSGCDDSCHASLVNFGSGSGFYLPPALDFNTHKHPESPAVKASTHQTQPSSQPSSRQRVLSPSSSRSSLSSASSSDASQTSKTISEQARSELRDYFSCFDHTREMKRRSLGSIAH